MSQLAPLSPSPLRCTLSHVDLTPSVIDLAATRIQGRSPTAALRRMLTEAVDHVTDLGYPVTDVSFETTDDGPSKRTRTLLVRGVPCFEVTVETSTWHAGKATITTTPRVLAWPEAIAWRPATARGVR